jgi:hypothetical protein
MAVDGTLLDVPDSKANARVFGYPGTRSGYPAAFPKVRLVLLIEAGTHLITDARICPYRMGERRRALKLLRSISSGMLLMWDRGLHSFRRVQTTLNQGGHYLGRVPANVKFEVEHLLDDGSYLSWIYPDRKSKNKGATRIAVRVIEYTIETTELLQQPCNYRLITSLFDIQAFPALVLAQQYHQRWQVESTLDEVRTHLLGRKVPIRPPQATRSGARNLWSVAGTLVSALVNGASGSTRRHLTLAFEFYRHLKCSASGSG